MLSRKRALTLPMIRKLAAGLGLRGDILIQESIPARRADPRRKREGNRRAPKAG